MKHTRRHISILLAVLLAVSAFSACFTVNASSKELCSKYATNPDSKVGIEKTITIDGSASDWSESMLIAQGAAWDVANNYKGGHENCVLDTYALFACWDSSNLYVGWQMVNTTDTWARSGDGPLSDGGRVLDVPLILALSVDPNSVSMSNKNTSGGSIWGQKMGVQFDVHVDHLFYMSGKPGLGEPSMFTAVDAQGNTNYTTGCQGFSKAGISYKMAETNICSHIWGLNGSKSTSDIYSDSANWVDFKTFKGSAGTHKTSYDSFYEIKIPFTALGIDKNYLETYGIGAMLVATRGESGLDCIPYDDTMLDNATGSYSSDPSTSKEKEDEDVITSPLAKIGNIGGATPTPVPTTQPVTGSPETQPVTTPSSTLTVNAKSNILSGSTYTMTESDTEVTVKYNLKSAMDIVNAQWALTYDASKLSLKSSSEQLMPNVSGTKAGISSGTVYGTFTTTSPISFSAGKTFVQAVFKKLGSGSTDVTLDLQELSVGYLSGGVLNYRNAVKNSALVNLSGVSGFSSNSVSGTSTVVSGDQTESGGVEMYGDVNGDGKVTIQDATVIQKHVARMSILTGTEYDAGDVNGDGVLSIQDATLIQKFVARMITSFPVEG